MTNKLESRLHYVNIIKVRMDDHQRKRNNELLLLMTSMFEDVFKKDPFFASIYERYFFGGSFYDGLKVGKPNEFDIDLVFKLPLKARPTICSSDEYPGYVQVHMLDLDSLQTNYYPPSYNCMQNLVDSDGYLSVPLIMRWFQALVQRALNYIQSLPDLRYKIGKCQVTLGPAITFQVYDCSSRQCFDVDFVPCFKFSLSQWPGNCRRCEAFKDDDQLVNEFLVVPKYPSSGSRTHMRLSFQGQERRLIDNKGPLKAAIRLLKLYRNNFNDRQIKSYYIKTLALWALQDESFTYLGNSLSYVFLDLFRRLMYAIQVKKLPYFWNPEFDFFADLNDLYCLNTYNRMRNHLREFDIGSDESITLVFTQCIPEAAYAQMELYEDLRIDYADKLRSEIVYSNMYSSKNSKYIETRNPQYIAEAAYPGLDWYENQRMDANKLRSEIVYSKKSRNIEIRKPALFYKFCRLLLYSFLFYCTYVNREILIYRFRDLCDFICKFVR